MKLFSTPLSILCAVRVWRCIETRKNNGYGSPDEMHSKHFQIRTHPYSHITMSFSSSFRLFIYAACGWLLRPTTLLYLNIFVFVLKCKCRKIQWHGNVRKWREWIQFGLAELFDLYLQTWINRWFQLFSRNPLASSSCQTVWKATRRSSEAMMAM